MKKQFTIFAFLVFFLAQFGKVINYCFCTIAAYQQTSSLSCDCEKQLFTDLKKETDTKHQLPHAYSSSASMEELFHLANIPSFVFQYTHQRASWPPASSVVLYQVFRNSVFRPPLQASCI